MLGIPFLHRMPATRDGQGLYYNAITHAIVECPDALLAEGSSREALLALCAAQSPDLLSAITRLVRNPTTIALDSASDRQILYLGLSGSCNLSCTYCHQQEERTCAKHMPMRVIEAAVSGFTELAGRDKKADIVLYGGEPLLNHDGMIWAASLVRQLRADGRLNGDATFTVLTNGTLLTEELIGVLAKSRATVSISLDGPYAVNDPRFGNNRELFDRVVRNAKAVRRAGLPLTLSCTAWPVSGSRLVDRVKWLLEEVQPSKLGINPPQYVTANLPSHRAQRAATREMLEAYEYLLSVGMAETYLTRVLRAFLAGVPLYRWCGSHREHVVVGPSGDLKRCLRAIRSDAGSIGVSVLSAEWPQRLRAWRMSAGWPLFDRFQDERCHSCLALGICGSGHRCNAIAQRDDRNGSTRDTSHCLYARALARWLLDRVAARLRAEVVDDVPEGLRPGEL